MTPRHAVPCEQRQDVVVAHQPTRDIHVYVSRGFAPAIYELKLINRHGDTFVTAGVQVTHFQDSPRLVTLSSKQKVSQGGKCHKAPHDGFHIIAQS